MIHTPRTKAYASTENFIYQTRVLIENAALIAPARVTWIWEGHLAAGKLTLLGGSPGTGKSGICLSIAAAISRPQGFGQLPDGSVAMHGNVVILASEDGVEDTIVPRLIAAGADMSHIHIVRGTMVNGRSRPFSAEDCERLRTELRTLTQVKIVIVDPITQMVGRNSNSNVDVRKALEPLIDSAESHGFAILGVAHLAKGSGKRAPLERIAGSLAFGALPRIVLLTVRGDTIADPEVGSPPAQCALVRIKSNIGPDGGGFSYTVREANFDHGRNSFISSRIYWEGKIDGSAKSILEAVEGARPISGSGELARAKAFLLEHLRNGPQLSNGIQASAEQQGISRATLRRAREDMGILAEKTKNDGPASPWAWSLPAYDQIEARGPQRMPAFEGPDTLHGYGVPLFPISANQMVAPATTGLYGLPSAGAQPFSTAPIVGHPLPGNQPVRVAPHGQPVQVAHLEQVAHLDQTAQVQRGEVSATVNQTPNENEESVEEIDIYSDFDQKTLDALDNACWIARQKLPKERRDDDDALNKIEELAINAIGASPSTYRNMLNLSDWRDN